MGESLEAAVAMPAMIAAYRTVDADGMARIHECSQPFNPERFAARERFSVGDVRRLARSRFGVAPPPARTTVCGVSARGPFLQHQTS